MHLMLQRGSDRAVRIHLVWSLSTDDASYAAKGLWQSSDGAVRVCLLCCLSTDSASNVPMELWQRTFCSKEALTELWWSCEGRSYMLPEHYWFMLHADGALIVHLMLICCLSTDSVSYVPMELWKLISYWKEALAEIWQSCKGASNVPTELWWTSDGALMIHLMWKLNKSINFKDPRWKGLLCLCR